MDDASERGQPVHSRSGVFVVDRCSLVLLEGGGSMSLDLARATSLRLLLVCRLTSDV